ncbi:hypothetical protein [Enterococcus wangshanyuanii]|uniref:Uncharacterized protein n=1 Tax=Enterococcus wangshanyuanii TaxID=2005703 RepID=A0ABQ1NEW9_9ENTE|nr:hypothetical protein [Enterococcus wangshanyuanii]GGC74570.1 hypothetical protein GCM10011573_00080 [Enterococcus wangshanyuanii]
MEKTKTIDQLTADAAYIRNALLGVEDIIEFRFSGGVASLKDTNKLNGVLTAIGCLAKQHEQDLIEFGKEGISR